MRTDVVETIYRAALKDPNIFLITGDLEHSSAKNFKQNLPDQHINIGMAEQNMIGVAAGLALSGKKVFTISIITFATMRCFEQIRNDICYQNLDVTVIGDGGGFYYSKSGATHNPIEDIAIMRTLPNMKIIAPADSQQARLLTEKIIQSRGPFYLRLGGKVVPAIEELRADGQPEIEMGKGQVIHIGSDVTIFSFGPIIREALTAAEILASCGIRAEIINLHALKPIDRELIEDRFNRRQAIFTLEEHSVIGGLGSAVAEIICPLFHCHRRHSIFKSFGIKDKFTKTVGSRQYLWQINGLTGQQIANQIIASCTCI
ncbi:MAG: transketolase C-terminal domain-containing protein [bacterium]|nr:transketolase C-terminal domain-containing protein [bacterium]